MKETLTFDTVPQGTCAICRMQPRAEQLDLTLSTPAGICDVTFCRDCLSEYAPQVLEAIEDDGA